VLFVSFVVKSWVPHKYFMAAQQECVAASGRSHESLKPQVSGTWARGFAAEGERKKATTKNTKSTKIESR
jgi:hypothetical protein